MEVSRQSTESVEDASETLFHNRRRCCFYLPCFERPRGNSSDTGLTWWQKIRTTDTAATNNSLWSRGVGTLMKIREWSEIVAGPRWKTFIRRFSRNRSGSGNRHVNFQYDPLSYAMNFDEGPGQNGQFDEGEEDGFYGSRNFSSRYAKGSMDLGKDGPTFV